MEKWKDIKEYVGHYQISDSGRVKSLKGTPKILKQDCKRYSYVCLYKNGKNKRFAIHRLVAQQFLPAVENKTQVNHKDGNRWNNNVDNLEWCSPKENAIHSNRILCKGRGRKIKQYNKKGDFIREWINAYQASEGTGICRRNINACVNGLYKSAGGYVWSWD